MADTHYGGTTLHALLPASRSTAAWNADTYMALMAAHGSGSVEYLLRRPKIGGIQI